MTRFVDLSHSFEDRMPGLRLPKQDGSFTEYTARIRPFLTHEQTLPNYQGKCSFEITEMAFPTSLGTYLDSPYHRYPEGRDISQLALDEVVLPGIVIPVPDVAEFQAVGPEVIPRGLQITDKAVLFDFDWSQYWGREEYYSYPYLSHHALQFLLKHRPKLVGVNTANVDNKMDLSRPVHTMLLKHEILILENLTNLHQLRGHDFRLFAVPLKAKKTAAMSVRAFAEILGS